MNIILILLYNASRKASLEKVTWGQIEKGRTKSHNLKPLSNPWNLISYLKKSSIETKVAQVKVLRFARKRSSFPLLVRFFWWKFHSAENVHNCRKIMI